MDRESAYYDMFHGTAHVVLASSLTIAGATLCLHFTRLPYFQSMGIPLAVGMTIVVAAALTLGPALISIVTRFGKVLEPKRGARARGWRRLGAATVRWPGAILVMALVLCMVGLLTLPGYHTTYNDRIYLPDDVPANVGYAATDRHFSDAKMNPDLVMVEADHDMRNPADFLVIEKIAKALTRVHGIASVTTITRPDGKPIKHASLAYTVSQSGTGQLMNNDFQQTVLENTLQQANEMQVTIDSMEKMQSITLELADVTRRMADKMADTSVNLNEVRDSLANFDDQFRPCATTSTGSRTATTSRCAGRCGRSSSLDGISTMSDDFAEIVPDLERMAQLTPQMAALMPAMIQTMKNQKQIMLNQYQAQKMQQDQNIAMQQDNTAMGRRSTPPATTTPSTCHRRRSRPLTSSAA